MKQCYLLLSLFIIATAQAQNDSIYFWKTGALLEKRSIKPVDLDSITFKRPGVNLPHVTICTQVWATKNLEVSTYNDGTPIPQVTDPTAWAALTTGAWCYYNNDPANGAIYGKLYNWYAVAGIYNATSAANPTLRKKLAPAGWHVPTDTEWTTLTTCLGGESVAGGKMKEAGTTHWNSPNTNATNSSGFTGLPGGFRNYDGTYNLIGGFGNWWSSSETGAAVAWNRYLNYYGGSAYRNSDYRTNGFSVRCLRD